MNIRVIFSILLLAHGVQAYGLLDDDGDDMTVAEFRGKEDILIDERDRSYQFREMCLGITLGTNLTLATKAALVGTMTNIDAGEIAFSTALGILAFPAATLANNELDKFRAQHPGKPYRRENRGAYRPGQFFLGGIILGALMHPVIKAGADNNFESQDVVAPIMVGMTALVVKNIDKKS